MICTGCERNSFLPLLLRFRPGKKSLFFRCLLRFRREAPKNCFLLFFLRFLSGAERTFCATSFGAKRRKDFGFFSSGAKRRKEIFWVLFLLIFVIFSYICTVLCDYIFCSSLFMVLVQRNSFSQPSLHYPAHFWRMWWLRPHL